MTFPGVMAALLIASSGSGEEVDARKEGPPVLEELSGRVFQREKGSVDWPRASHGLPLSVDDSLRAGWRSWARVLFPGGRRLAVGRDSIVIIKPSRTPAYDAGLLSGAVYMVGASVITTSAGVSPALPGSRYSVRVRDDQTTVVEVFEGAAEVSADGRKARVPAGSSCEVALGDGPARVRRAPGREGAEARLAEGFEQGKTGLFFDVGILDYHVPMASYRLQASRDRRFDRVVLDKAYGAEDPVDLDAQSLAPGRYWWRAMAVDALGFEGRFSAPREFQVGVPQAPRRPSRAFDGSFEVLRPRDGEVTHDDPYRVEGRADRDLSISVNGERVKVDPAASFSANVRLEKGMNTVRVKAIDRYGNVRVLERGVKYVP